MNFCPAAATLSMASAAPNRQDSEYLQPRRGVGTGGDRPASPLYRTWSYQLPFGKGQRFLNNNKVANYALGGWTLQGTFIIANGFPMFINQTNLNAGIGGAGQRPNATGVNACESGSPESRINSYFNPAAFSLAPAYTFGNLGRDVPCQGPGQANTDASIFKTVTIKERFSAQFRAEALNLTNTPYFAAPYDQFGQSNFGHINYQANIPRILQLGLRFAW